MQTSRIASWAGMLALMVTAGCASAGTSGAGGAEGAATTGEGGAATAEGSIVRIMNVAPGASTITVYVVPEVGVDSPLGTVEGGQTKDFAFAGQPGRYTIRVVGSSGTQTSQQFQFFRNSIATWDMSLGRNVRVQGRR
jgi:hypothetical protein